MEHRCVYVVEDDPGLGALMRRVLSGLPRVDVRLYDRAESALGDYELYPPQLLIADLGLPTMSGIELIARSRQWFDRLSVIVSTGCRSQFENELDGFADLEIWEKPFQILSLRDRVNELLGGDVAGRTKAFVPFGVLDCLQLASMVSRDLTLKMTLGDGRSATIQIVGGEIWDCRFGMLQGLEALTQALELEAEAIQFGPLDRLPRGRRIEGSTSQILLELAVDHDVKQMGASEGEESEAGTVRSLAEA